MCIDVIFTFLFLQRQIWRNQQRIELLSQQVKKQSSMTDKDPPLKTIPDKTVTSYSTSTYVHEDRLLNNKLNDSGIFFGVENIACNKLQHSRWRIYLEIFLFKNRKTPKSFRTFITNAFSKNHISFLRA